MKEKIENPQAFPYGYGTDIYERAEIGMTLRDYFATKAMQGIISHYGFAESNEKISITAFSIADEMLKERSL